MAEERSEPWIVPETPEGRETLQRLAAEYEEKGQLRELGITLTYLARLVKQIGTGVEGDGWATIAQIGQRAIEALRQTDDKTALAAALRATAQPFVGGIDRPALLNEARTISAEAGDLAGEGWALFALASFNPAESDALHHAA